MGAEIDGIGTSRVTIVGRIQKSAETDADVQTVPVSWKAK